MVPPTPQEQLKQVLHLLAYAEVRGLLVTLAQGSPWNPIWETSLAARRTREEGLLPGTESFGARVRDILRASSCAALEPAQWRGGPWPYDRPLVRGQVGGPTGIEELFDEAGRIAAWHRDRDMRLLSIAIQLFLRLQSSPDFLLPASATSTS